MLNPSHRSSLHSSSFRAEDRSMPCSITGERSELRDQKTLAGGILVVGAQEARVHLARF
ncbi:hypothetical protein PSCLAVI8L_100184 [Pseudoclavibacter sp. 8L]|nr:hypothetical protein PSCLAVI8L_100184 [Pseudoclavibacter sp. 8L]